MGLEYGDAMCLLPSLGCEQHGAALLLPTAMLRCPFESHAAIEAYSL